VQKIIDNNLEIIIFKSFLDKHQSRWLFEYCIQNIKWKQDKYVYSGKEVLAPRLTALYGEKKYTYSGQTLTPIKFTKQLERLKNLIMEETGNFYNIALLNNYRDGNDSVSWHTDAEKALGLNPVIASVSLGGKRVFKLREKSNHKNQHLIELEDGDLIIMKGQTQHFWEHTIPKSKKMNDQRINLTFRKII
jgi:alkylated DNA repair dioxygenase AlkB